MLLFKEYYVLRQSFQPFQGSTSDGKTSKTFAALDWLAQLTSHIPIPPTARVRYYGYFSNKSRGLREKAGTDDGIPVLIDSDISRKAFRKNWACLIQKIYNVDPLLWPKCLGSMRIIKFIEDQQIVKKILKHLGLWHVKLKPPPRANGPPTETFIIDLLQKKSLNLRFHYAPYHELIRIDN